MATFSDPNSFGGYLPTYTGNQIASLEDVDTGTNGIQNSSYLVYNSTTSKWESTTDLDVEGDLIIDGSVTIFGTDALNKLLVEDTNSTAILFVDTRDTTPTNRNFQNVGIRPTKENSGLTIYTTDSVHSQGIMFANASNDYTGRIFRQNRGGGDADIVFSAGTNDIDPTTFSEKFRIRYDTGISFPKSTVTQATNINTAVTVNNTSAVITTQTATTATNSNDAFTVNNDQVLATSVIHATVVSYSGTLGTNGVPVVSISTIAAGSFVINITNPSTNALNGTLEIAISVV